MNGTDSLNLIAPNTYWGVGVYNLGVAILKDSLRQAMLSYTSTDKKTQLSLAFVRGTGLERVLETFELTDLKASLIRQSFFYYLERQP